MQVEFHANMSDSASYHVSRALGPVLEPLDVQLRRGDGAFLNRPGARGKPREGRWQAERPAPMISRSKAFLAILAAMSMLGCRWEPDPGFAPRLLSGDQLKQGGMRKTYAVERGYPWEQVRDSTTWFVEREWRGGFVDTSGTEWTFFAKKSKWRIAGWGETPGELTGIDNVGEFSVRWQRDHYLWRRQFWTEFKEHSCEEAVVSRRYDAIPWRECKKQ